MDQYTHIVVGAGSAGSALAARLSADPSLDVLLVEAGPDYPNVSDLPSDLADASVPSQRDHDWGIISVGTGNRTLPMVRGKVIGGSSAVNACIALRPEPADFDTWPQSTSLDPGWSWESVLPFYRSLESDRDRPTDPAHGNAGPLPIRRWGSGELHPLSVAFLEAATSASFEVIADHNSPGSSGAGPLPMNSIDGRRISASEAYLAPVRSRNNLTILAGQLVDRVDFQGSTAVGISTVAGGRRERFRSQNTVLSAGAFGTPGILLRSGIGDRDELMALGIPLVADRPAVGRNLADHSQVPVGVEAVHPQDPASPAPCIQVLLRYSSGSEVRNDMQICLLNQVELKAFTPYLPDIAGHDDIFLVTSNLMAPEGRGRVTLASADPQENVHVHMDFCASPNDVRRHRLGLRQALSLVEDRAFSGLAGEVLEADALYGDDTGLDTFIERRVQTAHHPTGTARMGANCDPSAVVNSRGEVIGIENLFVADASIIPSPVRANTNLTCIMIGERIAAQMLASRTGGRAPTTTARRATL